MAGRDTNKQTFALVYFISLPVNGELGIGTKTGRLPPEGPRLPPREFINFKIIIFICLPRPIWLQRAYARGHAADDRAAFWAETLGGLGAHNSYQL